MANRETVIKELDQYIESALIVDSDYVDCIRTDLLQCTVALLKEQEAVVRCKDCKHSIVMDGRCWCEKYIPCSLVLSEWFCADAERKSEDD